MGRTGFLLSWIAAAVLLASGVELVLLPEVANATFPGTNGKISFVSNRSGTNQIYTSNPDGSDETKITNDQVGTRYNTWSPDGQKIAFVSDADRQIYTINRDGSDQTKITNQQSWANFPTWSPDGQKIAFENYADGEIYTINRDGTGLTRITNSTEWSEPMSSQEPAWSADSQQIAFAARTGDNRLIYTTNADGSGQPNYLASANKGGGPIWSPDSQKIAFYWYSNSGDGSIYVMNSDGSSLKPITNGIYSADFNPAWSPDGQKIVFERADYDSGRRDIYTMNSDGSDQTNITAPETMGSRADWSPDGKKILFSSTSGISTINSDGSGLTHLGATESLGRGYSPSWQPILSDNIKPSISIVTPTEGATYKLGSTVHTDYRCADEAGGSGLKSCSGTVPDGSAIDTKSTGAKTFTVTAEDNAGNTDSVTHSYYVTKSGKPPSSGGGKGGGPKPK